jgi:hypothetical protein
VAGLALSRPYQQLRLILAADNELLDRGRGVSSFCSSITSVAVRPSTCSTSLSAAATRSRPAKAFLSSAYPNDTQGRPSGHKARTQVSAAFQKLNVTNFPILLHCATPTSPLLRTLPTGTGGGYDVEHRPQHPCRGRRKRCPELKKRSDRFGRTLSSASNGLSQQEVLQHKLPFPPGERATADLTGYLAVGCLRPSFDFDDFIKRFAVRASKLIECASCHDTPQYTWTAATAA